MVNLAGSLSFDATPAISGSGDSWTVTVTGLGGLGLLGLDFNPVNGIADALGNGLEANPLAGVLGVDTVGSLPVHFVKEGNAGASPPYDSWATAAAHVQDALAAASGDQLWVAQGTYAPDQGHGQTAGHRDASFILREGLRLYGGFFGTEDDPSRSARPRSTQPSSAATWRARPARRAWQTGFQLQPHGQRLSRADRAGRRCLDRRRHRQRRPGRRSGSFWELSGYGGGLT